MERIVLGVAEEAGPSGTENDVPVLSLPYFPESLGYLMKERGTNTLTASCLCCHSGAGSYVNPFKPLIYLGYFCCFITSCREHLCEAVLEISGKQETREEGS